MHEWTRSLWELLCVHCHTINLCAGWRKNPSRRPQTGLGSIKFQLPSSIDITFQSSEPGSGLRIEQNNGGSMPGRSGHLSRWSNCSVTRLELWNVNRNVTGPNPGPRKWWFHAEFSLAERVNKMMLLLMLSELLILQSIVNRGHRMNIYCKKCLWYFEVMVSSVEKQRGIVHTTTENQKGANTMMQCLWYWSHADSQQV